MHSSLLRWLPAVLAFTALCTGSARAGQAPSADPYANAKQIIAGSRHVVSGHGIDELTKVRIGGIDQWLSIRGNDLRNPVLLYLHGGPASPTMPESYTFQAPWEDYFTVVQWDQRGAGKTYAANTEAQMAPGMTIAGMTADAEQVAQYLRQRFGKRKIFLLGHSWGTVLGVELAQRQPDWFYAYVGVGQIVNMRRNEQAGFDYAMAQAKAHGNAQAVRELQSIAPYPGDAPVTVERIGMRSKWEMYYGGLSWGRRDFDFDSNAWRLAPEYSHDDLAAIDKGSLFSLKHLLEPLLAVDFDQRTRFGCPVFMFVGAHDYTTSHTQTEQWFDRLRAPSKKLVVFADSAHMVMQEQPGRFLLHLVQDVRPLAVQAGDAAPDEVVR